MEKTKIRQIGTSLGIIIPADVLRRYDLKEGDEVSLSEEPGGIRLMMANDETKETLKIAEKIMDRYSEALQELANETE